MIQFQSTLSLRRATWGTMLHTAQFPVFQSTLSLRRATGVRSRLTFGSA